MENYVIKLEELFFPVIFTAIVGVVT